MATTLTRAELVEVVAREYRTQFDGVEPVTLAATLRRVVADLGQVLTANEMNRVERDALDRAMRLAAPLQGSTAASERATWSVNHILDLAIYHLEHLAATAHESSTIHLASQKAADVRALRRTV